MTVVDVGCATRHGADSIQTLLERYQPDRLYGFDPGLEDQECDTAGCHIVVSGKAAWTRDGTVGFTEAGMVSQVAEGGPQRVPCFDFSAWLATVDDDEIIVKVDAEGTEYPLLEQLVATGNDRKISRLLVEWHDNVFYASERRDQLLQRLSPPVEEWDL